MKIKKNLSYITENQKRLIDKDYGKMSVYSLNFSRYYNEEEKANNSRIYETMTHEQWEERCNEIQKHFGIMFDEIEEKLINSKYDIHQLTDATSTMEHYRSNWDLYYYCNRNRNNSGYMDHFKLSFNSNRTVEENLKLLDELIEYIKTLDYKNILCTIQYTFIPNKEKINNKYVEICDKLQNKFIEYAGMIGKIKVVRESENNKEYGFFKKGSRKKYYSISKENLILLENKL